MSSATSVIRRFQSRKVVVGMAAKHRRPGHSVNRAQFQGPVLIVDDQFTGRKILEALVRSIDPTLRVESHVTPQAALDFVRQHTPDLIVTDYKMPGMDGIEFIKRIREIPGCEDVPLIVITVVEDRRIRYEALDAGATDFLTRPVDQHEFLTRCRNLLTIRRQQQIIKYRASWLEQQVTVATQEIQSRERETLFLLAKAGEYRDEETGNHVLRMAKYARYIAEGLSCDPDQCEEIELAAPMHDVGKIGISDRILLKADKLTPEEWEIMKTHTTIGYEILKGSSSRYTQLGSVIALGHHEKWDGSGYPYGLRGEDIPLAARIVAVADVYDALTSVRPYKKAWPSEEAVKYITEQAGKHFDPRCVDSFIKQCDKIRHTEELLRDFQGKQPEK